MKLLLELLVVCLLGSLHAGANAQPEDMGLREDERHVARRYAESTIASEMSKIMDSVMQKNFVDFLLNQRQKKSEAPTAEGDPRERPHSDPPRPRLRERRRREV